MGASPDTADTVFVSLRSAKVEDWPAIMHLLEETWHDSYDHILGRTRVKLILKTFATLKPFLGNAETAQSFPIVVAQIEDRIVGFATAECARSGKGTMLWMLYIRPSHQKLGIGELLLENVLSRLPAASIAKLQVLPDNHRAIRFYERMGFKKTHQSFDLWTCARVLNMQRTIEA
jgi:ribosomal protein S18 acetylase RimI-like enzyme